MIGCVGVGDGGLPERQLAEVHAVVQRADDLVARPRAAAGGAVAPVVEDFGDGAGAEPVLGVEVEDQPHDHRLVLVDDRGSGWSCRPGSRRDVCRPSIFPWRALRSMPAMTRSMMVSRSNWANMPSICTSIRPIGVEVSNGSVARAEHHADGVEFVEQHHHVPQVAGEPVHPVHQQHVDQPGAGGGRARVASPGAFGGGTGGVVGEPRDEPPAGLGVDVGFPGACPGLRSSRAGARRRWSAARRSLPGRRRRVWSWRLSWCAARSLDRAIVRPLVRCLRVPCSSRLSGYYRATTRLPDRC